MYFLQSALIPILNNVMQKSHYSEKAHYFYPKKIPKLFI